MPNADRTLRNIILDYHLFKLDDIIKSYESRLVNPDPVLEDNNRETKEPIKDQFRAYGA